MLFLEGAELLFLIVVFLVELKFEFRVLFRVEKFEFLLVLLLSKFLLTDVPVVLYEFLPVE